MFLDTSLDALECFQVGDNINITPCSLIRKDWPARLQPDKV